MKPGTEEPRRIHRMTITKIKVTTAEAKSPSAVAVKVTPHFRLVKIRPHQRPIRKSFLQYRVETVGG
jgi:hypothetical protein